MFSRITFKTEFLLTLFIREICFISISIRLLFVGLLVTIKIYRFYFFFNWYFFVLEWRYVGKHFFKMSLSLLCSWDLHTWSLLMFHFPRTSSLHSTQKKPAPRRGVSYQIFVISYTKICNAPESYLYLCQYLFNRRKNLWIPYMRLCSGLVNIFHPICPELILILLLCWYPLLTNVLYSPVCSVVMTKIPLDRVFLLVDRLKASTFVNLASILWRILLL